MNTAASSSLLNFSAAPTQPVQSATRLHARASADFAAKLAHTQELLRQAAVDYTTTAGRVEIIQASSLGAEDVVITHLLETLCLSIPVFVLDTGELHTDTLQLLQRSQERRQTQHHAPLQVYQPQAEAVIEFVQRNGNEAMYQSIALRKACCNIRKMEPLARALQGHRAWITGLRREQSGARAEVPFIDSSEVATTGRTKLNPLAAWTWGDVWHYIATNNVDYNPLHDQFFPSIGCRPCTRAIALGEDFRAGRWWWEDETAKECGLHVKTATVSPATAHAATKEGTPA